jgi:hypothetical protein
VVAEAELTAAAVVRIRGDFTTGCEPRVSRRFRGGDGWLDVPLPVERRAGDLVVSLPPALAPVGEPARAPTPRCSRRRWR